MAFDPDAYLSSKKSSAGGFDPDAYLSNKTSAQAAQPVEAPKERSALDVYRDATNVTNWPGNIAAGLRKIDEYTGAPIRKFVTEAVTGKDLENAPTGAEQAKMMGATDVTYGEKFGLPPAFGGNISPADIYGVGLEIAQDPLTLFGVGKKVAEKALVKTAPEIAEQGVKQSAKAFQSQSTNATAQAGAKSSASISGGGSTVEQGGQLFSVKAPQSLDELRQWKPSANAGELPGKQRLQQIEQTVADLETKPLKYHYDMMENPKAMKDLKTEFENLPTDDAKRIAAYNQQIVDESARKVQDTVSGMAKSEIRELSDAGQDLIMTVKDKYNAEKDMLGPMFQELQKRSYKLPAAETQGLAIAIGENSKLGKLIVRNEETGKLALAKNTPRTGLSNQEHGVLSQVIDDLNDGMTFKELQDTRAFLKKSVDPANPGASAEIEKVRSIMLGQLEEMATKQGPDVGQTFKSYAVNERARESFEKIIGGRIETLDSMYAANPDKVVQKIFSNPNYVKVVTDYVGPDKMQDLVAAYVNNGIKVAYDQAKGFDPTKLRGWLKKNDKFLANYASPEVSQRLNALADYGYYGKRYLDEVNPSGTAASLIAAIKPEGFIQRVRTEGIRGALTSEAITRATSASKQRQASKLLNEKLGGESAKKASNFQINPEIAAQAKRLQGTQVPAAAARGLIQESKAVPKSAEEKQEKGFPKWANDGLKKLKSADTEGILSDPKVIEKLNKNAKGQGLLLEANKKGADVDRILLKIKSSYLQGAE